MKHLLEKFWLLLLIFCAALFLRTYRLSSIPVGLHGDEASIGYNAYSLLKTGKDQNGNLLPLAIDQFGDFRPAGYHYLDIPFVAFLGLTELAVRLPAAIFGAASIFVFYALVLELFGNKKLALLCALLLTISPWHIVISRATSEGVIAAFFIMLGILFFIKSVKERKKNLPFLLCSFVFFSISFFFYHSARFFVPIFLGPLLLFCFLNSKPNRKTLLQFGGFMVALLTVLAFILIAGSGGNRPLDISILNIPGGTTQVKHAQDTDGTQNPLLTRFFHNKLYFYTRLFASSYFRHFDGDFLFVTNGFPVRYKVPWSGNVYPIEAPFLLFGFAVLLVEGVKSKKYIFLLPIAWLFLGAVPAGLTWEDIPNIQRASLMLYPLLVIGAFGMQDLYRVIRPRWKILFSIVVILFYIQDASYFFHMYFYHSSIEEPWYRSAAVKEVVFKEEELTKEYGKFVMTTQGNNNLIHHLFYSKFDPALFQQMGSPKENDGLHFQKTVYTDSPCPLTGREGELIKHTDGTIYLDKADCKLPLNVEILTTIRHPDGIPAYIIVKSIDPVIFQQSIQKP